MPSNKLITLSIAYKELLMIHNDQEILSSVAVNPSITFHKGYNVVNMDICILF